MIICSCKIVDLGTILVSWGLFLGIVRHLYFSVRWFCWLQSRSWLGSSKQSSDILSKYSVWFKVIADNQDSDFYVLVSLGHMDNCMDVCVFAAAAAAKSLHSCPTLWPHRWQPTRLPRPWDSPGKNTGVGCHFLLQCMKVKSESEVAQLCPNLSDHMDYSPPGSSIHGIVQARVLERGAIAFSVCVYSKL